METLGTGILTEQFVIKKGSSDHGKVMGGGIVIFVMQAIGIHKMGIGASKFFGPLIHHIRKSVKTSADQFCNAVCRIVCRGNQNRLKSLIHSDLVAYVEIDFRSVYRDAEYRLIRHRDHVVKACLFRGDQTGKYFGGTCRI